MELQDVNLVDPDMYADGVPHDTFALLRREAPAYWQDEPGGSGFWAFTRHEDVVHINRDSATFSSERGGTLMEDHDEETLEGTRQMMLNMDPPKHTRYRLLVNRGFTPKRVREMEPHIRDLARGLVDNIAERGSCDFVDEIAAELPLQVIAELMGVPHEDRRMIFDWSNTLIGAHDPEFQPDPQAAMQASTELYSYAHALADERRKCPADDVVTTLLNAEVEGHKLTEHERDMFFILFAVGGNETTRNSISHGMHALIQHPDQRQRLIDNPDLIDTAVDEIVRWATPVMFFRRTATADTEVRGQKIAEGDKVLIYYMSANFDEDVFDDPRRFDIGRTPNDHVGFGGGGPHYCLGATLARLEIKIIFEELLSRLPDIELAGPVERMRSNWINGVKRMPIEYTPARVSTGASV